MRKLILLFITLATISTSQDINSKLFEKILVGLFPNNENITLFITDDSAQFDFSKKIHVVDNVKLSNIVLVNSNNARLEKYNKVLFVTSYKDLKKYDNAIGALYWKKGRPQVVFLKKRLDNYDIKVADYLNKYIE